MPAKRIHLIAFFTCPLPIGLLAGLTEAEVLAPRPAPPQPVPPIIQAAAEGSTQLYLDGLVMTPSVYDRAALAVLPQSSVTAGNVTYSGVALWTLLSKAGLVTDPNVKNDILRKLVTATASDGYKIAISLGEIDPRFGNQPCLIALQENGADFTTGGFARLVFPNDVKKGRWVYNLTRLKVSEGP